MWRAYLLRDQLGGKFDELVNIVVLWSALRRGATRESGYQANRDLLVKYKKALFRRYAAGKLKGQMIPLRRAELLGRRLLERISRRLESSEERRSKAAHRQWVREREDRRKVYREHPDIDTEVLQKGFGFLFAMVRAPLPVEVQKVREYVRELFDLEMRTFPEPVDKDDNYEFEGTPYHFDDWVMRLVAKFIAHTNSPAAARTLYVPILELGPAARYWVEDFLQAWIIVGLETTADTAEFVKIWRDMVEYTVTLSAWAPADGNYWCRAESLAVDLMGLHKEAASILGQAKYIEVVGAMIPVFEEWTNRWLKFGTIAAWFADFLTTESGAVLLSLGIKNLSNVVSSFQDRDWQRGDLGGLLTSVLSICWRKRQREVESDSELRQAFLRILTELCSRQTPEALHLRIKVAESLSRTSD
jgi:hypothetical protein